MDPIIEISDPPWISSFIAKLQLFCYNRFTTLLKNRLAWIVCFVQALLAQQLQKKQLTNHIQQLQQQLVYKAQEQQATVTAVNNQVQTPRPQA